MNTNTIKRTAQIGLIALFLAHSVPVAAESISSGKGSSVTSTAKTASITKEIKASAVLPDQGMSVVQRISGKQVWINGVSYRVSDAVAGILNEQNKEILEQAGIRFNSKNGTVTSITGLEIRTSGEEARADGISRNLVLKGNQASIQGDLTIHADFVLVEGLNVEGQLVIDLGKGRNFQARNVTVKKAAVVHGSTNNTVVFDDSVLDSVVVNNTEAHVIFAGKTTSQELQVKSDSTIQASDTVNIPWVNIGEGVSRVSLQGNLGTVNLDTSQPLELYGHATIGQLVVDGSGLIAVHATGSIRQLQVNNPASQISLESNVSLTNISLASEVPLSSVTGNNGDQ